MINIFMPMRFYIGDPIRTVHKEVAKRLDPKEFRVYAYSMMEKSHPNHISLIEKTYHSYKGSFIERAITILPKILSIPSGIIHTVAEPKFLLLYYIRKIRDFKGKHIITLHGLPGDFKGDRNFFMIGKYLSKDADAITSVSKFTAKIVKRYYNVESEVIYNGVCTNFFRPSDHINERPKILYVGRLVFWKKPQFVAKMAKFFPKCDFIIHGRGPMKEELDQIAKRQPNLIVDSTFLDRYQLRELYAKSDIFFFPSIDWFGLVCLEAMACGLPLLINCVGGQSELIKNGKHGLLARTFEEMKKNLSYFIEDENTRRNAGKEARYYTQKNFDWKKIVPKYEELYKKVYYN